MQSDIKKKVELRRDSRHYDDIPQAPYHQFLGIETHAFRFSHCNAEWLSDPAAFRLSLAQLHLPVTSAVKSKHWDTCLSWDDCYIVVLVQNASQLDGCSLLDFTCI